jgi:hypothetical protein
MSGIGDDTLFNVLKAIFRNTTWTAGANLYLALYTAGPADSGVGTEVAGGGYARKAVAFADPVGSWQVNQNGAVLFDPATAPWGTISGLGIWTLSAGGVLVTPGLWAAPFTVGAYDQCNIATGAIVVSG